MFKTRGVDRLTQHLAAALKNLDAANVEGARATAGAKI
jgi:hypothetical protein